MQKNGIKDNKINSIRIIFGISIAILFGSTYLIYRNQVVAAKISINEQNVYNRKSFINSKNIFFEEFAEQYPNQSKLFNNYFDSNEDQFKKDTLVSFFIYSSKLPIIKYDDSYYRCLILKCEYEMEKIKIENEIKIKLDNIKRSFGQEVENWYQKIGKGTFLDVLSANESCNSFFEKTNKVAINNTAFKEFREFLSKVKNDKNSYRKQTEKSTARFNSLVRKANQSLTSSGRKIFERQMGTSIFLSERTIDLVFNGDVLGNVSYSFPVKVFKENKFNLVLDNLYSEQYKDNSLRNGAKPYSYCFESNNRCGGYDCSQIIVKTPYNSDVLVTIKKKDKVYRHAYISAGSSYTFNLSNGTYQPFFYYGKGWNPNKFMKNTSCGELKGGFISNEHFGKDNPQNFYNSILTYTLIKQQGGNFSTKPSNKEEAF